MSLLPVGDVLTLYCLLDDGLKDDLARRAWREQTRIGVAGRRATGSAERDVAADQVAAGWVGAGDQFVGNVEIHGLRAVGIDAADGDIACLKPGRRTVAGVLRDGKRWGEAAVEAHAVGKQVGDVEVIEGEVIGDLEVDRVLQGRPLNDRAAARPRRPIFARQSTWP